MMRRDPLLIVDGLRVTFDTPRGPVVAVRDVNFVLGREKLGIVGESGSGKSQTGRALLGLLARNGRVAARRLSFDGVDLLRAGEAERRALRGGRIAMILQDPKYSLNPVMTSRANRRGLSRACERVPARGAAAGARDAGGRAHSGARLRVRCLAARALGRHGPAGHDRDDDGSGARSPHRRRADLGTRRHGASPGPRAA